MSGPIEKEIVLKVSVVNGDVNLDATPLINTLNKIQAQAERTGMRFATVPKVRSTCCRHPRPPWLVSDQGLRRRG